MDGSIPLTENDIDITEKEEDRGKDQATLSKNSGQPCSSEEIAELINSSTSFNIRGVPYIQDSLELCNPTLRTAMLNDVKILKSWIESLFYNRFSAKPTKSDLSFVYDPTKQALIVSYTTSGNQSFPSDFWDAINEELLNPSDPLVKNIENPDKREFENANYPNGSKPTPVSQVTVPVKFKDPNTIVYDFKEKKYYQYGAVVIDHSQLKSGPIQFVSRDFAYKAPNKDQTVEFVDTSHYRVSDHTLLKQTTNGMPEDIKKWGCSFTCYLNSAIEAGMPTPTTNEVIQIFDMCKRFRHITGSATTQHPRYIGPMAALFLELTKRNENHFTTLQNCEVKRIEYSASTLLYPNCQIDDSPHFTTLLKDGREWDPFYCKDVDFAASGGKGDDVFLSQRRITGSNRRLPIGFPETGVYTFLPLPAGTVNDVIDYMHLKDISAKDKENYILMYEKGNSHDQLPQTGRKAYSFAS